MADGELMYCISLGLIKGVGPVLAKNLVGYCGGAEAIFTEKKSRLEKIPGIGSQVAEAVWTFRDFEKAEKEVEFIKKHGIKALFFTDKEYPIRLKQIPDSPILLFMLGDVNLDSPRVIGIVGTRKPTDYGKAFCEKFIRDLSSSGCVVVSGLAYGIDVISHRNCLKNSIPTIGVLAHGLDRIYPPLHAQTAREMVKKGGGLLSEHFSGTQPDRENFPKRNRIVAGLVDALVVVETAKRGGSMITAELAFQYDRDVFALPGKAGDEKSEGCNHLIRTLRASLLENADDLSYALGWETKSPSPVRQRELFVELNGEEEGVMEVLRESGSLDLDGLANKTGIPTGKLALTLLELEFKGLIQALPGKMFQLV